MENLGADGLAYRVAEIVIIKLNSMNRIRYTA